MSKRRKKAKSAIVKGLLDVTKTAETLLSGSDSDSSVDSRAGNHDQYIRCHLYVLRTKVRPLVLVL